MNQYYTFKCLSHGEKTVVTSAGVTWGDVADRFYTFLLACGFQVSRAQLSGHFWESSDSAEPDTHDDGDEKDWQFSPESETEMDNHASQYGLATERDRTIP